MSHGPVSCFSLFWLGHHFHVPGRLGLCKLYYKWITESQSLVTAAQITYFFSLKVVTRFACEIYYKTH